MINTNDAVKALRIIADDLEKYGRWYWLLDHRRYVERCKLSM